MGLENENVKESFNDFSNQEELPYQIISYLFSDNTNNTENFWKCLRYTDVNCLKKPNLTLEEKKKMVWQGQSEQQDYQVFLKPLIGDAMTDAQSQTQLRIFRLATQPINQITANILIEMDVLTNEGSCLVRNEKGMICERTDKLEGYLMNLLNGRDINIGSGVFRFDRTANRGCGSLLNISNSKSFYGRSIVFCLTYVHPSTGGC